MPRILVCSDSHSRADLLALAFEQQPTAECFVFLGDGVQDAAFFSNRLQTYIVRGNCDGSAPYPLWQEFTLLGKKIMCTHGHGSYVKYSDADLLYTAKANGAALVLYGHTHVPRIAYEEGVHLFNPGSINAGAYGFVDITPAGIICRNLKVRRWFEREIT